MSKPKAQTPPVKPKSAIVERFAARVLDGGMAIWDKWGNHPHAPFRKVAVAEQAKALINHDRILTHDTRGRE